MDGRPDGSTRRRSPRRPSRQGRRRRLLHLHLHQLAPDAPVCASVVGDIRRSGPRGGRRPHAGVLRSSTTPRTRAARCRDACGCSRSRSTATTRSGTRSRTTTGRRCTSSTRAADPAPPIRRGRLRRSEKMIQQLLADAGAEHADREIVDVVRDRPEALPIGSTSVTRDLPRVPTGAEFRVAGRHRGRAEPRLPGAGPPRPQ